MDLISNPDCYLNNFPSVKRKQFCLSSLIIFALILKKSSTNALAPSKLCNLEFSLSYPTQYLPAAQAACTPFVLSSLTIHSSLIIFESDDAYKKIAVSY